MTREDSIRQIENYPPFNEQEEKDKALILGWISNNENAFSRENTVAHTTASAWVVNKDRSKVLMVYHNIYNSWSWMGGHAGALSDPCCPQFYFLYKKRRNFSVRFLPFFQRSIL